MECYLNYKSALFYLAVGGSASAVSNCWRRIFCRVAADRRFGRAPTAVQLKATVVGVMSVHRNNEFFGSNAYNSVRVMLATARQQLYALLADWALCVRPALGYY